MRCIYPGYQLVNISMNEVCALNESLISDSKSFNNKGKRSEIKLFLISVTVSLFIYYGKDRVRFHLGRQNSYGPPLP